MSLFRIYLLLSYSRQLCRFLLVSLSNYLCSFLCLIIILFLHTIDSPHPPSSTRVHNVTFHVLLRADAYPRQIYASRGHPFVSACVIALVPSAVNLLMFRITKHCTLGRPCASIASANAMTARSLTALSSEIKKHISFSKRP